MKRYRVTNKTERPIIVGFAPRQPLVLIGAEKEIDRGLRNYLAPGQSCEATLGPRDAASLGISGDLEFVEIVK